MKKILFSVLVVISTSTLSYSQLTGLKSIPGDYPTVAAAITDLNLFGAGDGGVTFNIAAGHSETFSSPTSGRITTLTGSEANPIIFQKSGEGENPAITAATPGIGTMDAMICIAGCDYVTFDGLKLIENGANNNGTKRMEWGIAVLKASASDGSQHITIKNCSITLNQLNTNARGIYSNNHTATSINQLTVTSLTGTNSNLKIYGNTISNCITSIFVKGYKAPSGPYAFYDQDNEIGVDAANVITNVGGGNVNAYGIYTAYQNNLKVANNNITSTMGGLGYHYGIMLDTAKDASFDLYANFVSMQFSGDPYNSSLNGISSIMGESGASNIANIYNNTVTNCTFSTVLSAEINLFNVRNLGVTANVYGNVVSNNTLGSPSQAVTSALRYFWCQKSSSLAGPLTVHDNMVTGNTKLDVGTGSNSTYYLAVLGSGTTLDCYNNTIDDNSAASRGSTQCLYVTYNDEEVKNIYNNSITNITEANGSTSGIWNGNGTLAFIYNNIIQGISSSASGTIFMTGINHTNQCASAYYFNNMICDLDNQGSISDEGYDYTTLCGINIESESPGYTPIMKGFYNNTVYLNSETTASTFGSSAFFAYTLYGVDLRNNIFVNTSESAGTEGKTVGIKVRTPGFTGFS